MVHDGASCCSMHRSGSTLAPTVRHASQRHEQEPLPGGLTTPFRAAQHCDRRLVAHATSRLVAHTAPLARWRQRARPSRPPERNWEAMATRWKRRWNRRHPPTLPKGTCRETPPNPQTEQNQHPPGASQRPTPDCSAAEPPHVGAPAFSSTPAGGQNLPTGAHSRRCTGLRAGARVSKRASAPGSSFRTHACG